MIEPTEEEEELLEVSNSNYKLIHDTKANDESVLDLSKKYSKEVGVLPDDDSMEIVEVPLQDEIPDRILQFSSDHHIQFLQPSELTTENRNKNYNSSIKGKEEFNEEDNLSIIETNLILKEIGRGILEEKDEKWLDNSSVGHVTERNHSELVGSKSYDSPAPALKKLL